MTRYLTKSRFKLALECETKLFYTHKAEYCDRKIEDAFLEALAEGGFQVGELARCYYPEGVRVEEMDAAAALRKTNELLELENVVVFEAAAKFQNLFARIDILKKQGNNLQLIEVKSKSFDGTDQSDMLNKKTPEIAAKWRLYVYDVAFQKLILRRAFPHHEVHAWLMLSDKNRVATVDGLNQLFRIVKENGRARVVADADIDKDKLGEKILVEVQVDDIIQNIYDGYDFPERDDMSFENWVYYLAEQYGKDEKIPPQLAKKCKECEFRCPEDVTDKKDGLKECWSEVLAWDEDDFEKPAMLDIWNFRKKDALITEGKLFMEDLTKADIGFKPSQQQGLSATERQWVQIEKTLHHDKTPYLDVEGLKNEIRSWKYPLHFIDFETTALAIPFYKNFHPYEGVAFQFSHHQVEADGSIAHAGEFIHLERGKFPNFEFVRALKAQLENDQGTIFRYHNHENTYLNIIYRQLSATAASAVPDRQELMDFIRSITHHNKEKEKICGPRDMVDLYEMVKRYYYHIDMGGSISLKYVLPAVLNSSEYLQKKYSAPIYGNNNGIPSLNYNNWTWIRFDEDGKVKNPYDILPPLFEALTDEQLSTLMTDENYLKEGGAAMMAYARMQFSEMTDLEFEKLRAGLLKYCELDTFAMVLLWEYFANAVEENER
ncbi:MAG: DUF2779 domain-containing protein [Bacteroidales bacterium]|nr:DUF2779 domain-containing protein [Bacteroidales bacterium]